MTKTTATTFAIFAIDGKKFIAMPMAASQREVRPEVHWVANSLEEVQQNLPKGAKTTVLERALHQVPQAVLSLAAEWQSPVAAISVDPLPSPEETLLSKAEEVLAGGGSPSDKVAALRSLFGAPAAKAPAAPKTAKGGKRPSSRTAGLAAKEAQQLALAAGADKAAATAAYKAAYNAALAAEGQPPRYPETPAAHRVSIKAARKSA
jgi:hypothetical protein